MVIVVVVVALVLRCLANDRADTRASRTANQSALQATAKDCTQRSAASRANKCAFAGADATLLGLLVVVVMVRVIVVVVVVATLRAVTHAVVVGIVIVVLGERGNDCSGEQKRSDENHFSKLAHLRLDAGYRHRRVVSFKFSQPKLRASQKSFKKTNRAGQPNP